MGRRLVLVGVMEPQSRLPLLPARWLAAVLFSLAAAVSSAETLRVQGSTTVNPVVTEALEILAREQGRRYRIDTLGGSSGGSSAVGQGLAEVGMSSKAVSGEDRERFAGAELRETRIGIDAVALVVSPDLWSGGLRALSKVQVREIYERRARNWKALGGPDQRVVFFNKEPGRGTWTVFADWLYGSANEAPPVSHLEVGANSEARTKVARTPGALSQLSFAWADQETVFALSIRGEDGRLHHPTVEAIAAGDYPLSRPLILVTRGEPSGTAKELIDFLLGEAGQELVRKHGYLALEDARKRGP